LIDPLSVLLGLGLFFSVALVSGNNLAACVGTAVGARVISRTAGMALGSAGFVVGLLLQGASMLPGLRAILPSSNPVLVTEILFVTVVIFLGANIFRIPLSLTMSLVGLLAGVSTAHHFPVRENYLVSVLVVWFMAPAAAMLVMFCSVRLLGKFSPRHLWHRIASYKVLLIAFSFLTAYVLGANTLGLVVAIGGFNVMTVWIAVLGIFCGSFFLSSGTVRRIGHEIFTLRYSNALLTLVVPSILVELATLFAIPLSITETAAAGVMGAGLSYQHKCISVWPFTVIVIGWIIVPILSFLIGLLI